MIRLIPLLHSGVLVFLLVYIVLCLHTDPNSSLLLESGILCAFILQMNKSNVVLTEGVV